MNERVRFLINKPLLFKNLSRALMKADSTTQKKNNPHLINVINLLTI